MLALEIQQLHKSFGSNKVIDGLNLVVPENSIYGLLGQNGAGKTTTMKMTLGLLKIDSGTIKVFGENVHYGQTPTNQHIGFLPDVPEFYGYMKPQEYLELCGRITGIPEPLLKPRIQELLTLVGLENAKKRIGGYSRGMKQRLGIAQAMINEPKLLICDEPTSALDPIGRKEILDILLKLKGKTTVIFSTHILSDVERICDHIGVLSGGKLALEGNLSEIKENGRTDIIEIEFASKEQLSQFRELDATKAYFSSDNTSKLSVEGSSLYIETESVKSTQLHVLKILAEAELVPNRIELLEPTLENLFMEVVK